jgi:hypothetical protein
VVQARAARIESLADEVSQYAPDAASQMRNLIRDFRYDELAAALRRPDSC